MIDVILLRVMRHRKEYQILRPLLHLETFEKLTAAILEDFGKYFDVFPTHSTVDLTTFITRFRAWHPGITDERIREIARIVSSTAVDADDDQKAAILQEIADADITIKLANFVASVQEGDIGDMPGELERMMDNYRRSRNIKQIRFIDTPIRELLQDEFNDAGVAWRLHCLNDSMRHLRGGDFGIIAGRPDRGKTSFIASEISFMAPQLPDERNVLWLNNEGPGKRIIPRVWQATLGLNMNEMKAMAEADVLESAFRKIMKRFDKIRIVDIHGLNNSQVEMIIDQNNAGIVVYDMIDNIGGFGDSARTDQKLEQMYQWARERAVKYDAIGLATSQISVDGEGMRFPEMHMLKDSKTGKQGACDFQLMIGSISDENSKNLRWTGTPKNKLTRPGHKTDPRAEVIFDAMRSLYKDAPLNPLETPHDSSET